MVYVYSSFHCLTCPLTCVWRKESIPSCKIVLNVSKSDKLTKLAFTSVFFFCHYFLTIELIKDYFKFRKAKLEGKRKEINYKKNIYIYISLLFNLIKLESKSLFNNQLDIISSIRSSHSALN